MPVRVSAFPGNRCQEKQVSYALRGARCAPRTGDVLRVLELHLASALDQFGKAHQSGPMCSEAPVLLPTV
jgi:hypothetical protein